MTRTRIVGSVLYLGGCGVVVAVASRTLFREPDPLFVLIGWIVVVPLLWYAAFVVGDLLHVLRARGRR